MISSYELMHLADSALPAGGYAFSSGLESAYRLGLLGDEDALREYIEGFLHGVATAELPYVAAGFAADADELARAVHQYGATQTAPAPRRASLVLGRNWLRLLERLYPGAEVAGVRGLFKECRLPLYYPPVFGRGLAALGCELGTGRELYLFQAARDQVSAAVRLGAIGPMAGSGLQLGLYRFCRRLDETHGGRSWRQASRSAPLVDLVQLHHDHLYSRLFQS